MALCDPAILAVVLVWNQPSKVWSYFAIYWFDAENAKSLNIQSYSNTRRKEIES